MEGIEGIEIVVSGERIFREMAAPTIGEEL